MWEIFIHGFDKINKKAEKNIIPLCKMTKEKINYCILYRYINIAFYSKIDIRRNSSYYYIKTECTHSENNDVKGRNHHPFCIS